MFEDKQMLKAIVAEWITNPGQPIDANSVAINLLDYDWLPGDVLSNLVDQGYLRWFDENDRQRKNSNYDSEEAYKIVRPTAKGIFEALS